MYSYSCTEFKLNTSEVDLMIASEKQLLMSQKTNFDISKFSLATRPRGHKQRKLNDHVYSFLLFVSSRPHYQVEF